ncbi:MAG: M48 family metallopeptidase [Armatimonadota bacterium]
MKNRVICFLFLVVLFIIITISTFVKPAYAGIKETRLNDKPIKLINRLHELDKSFPAKLASPNEIFLVIYATSTTSDVYVLADPSVNPQQLALKLESAVKGTNLTDKTVKYMSADSYTCANVYISTVQMFAVNASMRHQVGLIMSRLQKSGLRLNTVLCIPKFVEISPVSGTVMFRSKKYDYYRIDSNKTNLDLTVSVNITAIDILYYLFFFLLTAFVLIVCIRGHVFISYYVRDKRDTNAGRRKMFADHYQGLLLITLSMIIILMGSQIYGYRFNKLLDAWIGTKLVFLIQPFLIISIFALMFSSQNIARRRYPLDDNETPGLMQSSFLNFRLFSPGVLIFIIVLNVLKHTNAYNGITSSRLLYIPFVILLVFVYILMSNIINLIWIRIPRIRWEDKKLLERYLLMAAYFELPLRQVYTVRNRNYDIVNFPIKYQMNNTLIIEKKLVESLSLEKLDYLIASEMSFVSKGYRRESALLLISGLILNIGFALMLMFQPLKLSLFNWQIWGMIAGLALIIYTYYRFVGYIRDSDKKALLYADDVWTAIEALSKAFDIFTVHLADGYKSINSNFGFPLRRIAWLYKSTDKSKINVEPSQSRKSYDDNLTCRVKKIAESMGIKADKLEFQSYYSQDKILKPAFMYSNNIVIRYSIVSKSNDDEIDFMLAHELTHRKNYDGLKSYLIMILTPLSMLVSGIMISISPLTPAAYWMLVVLISGVLLISEITWLRRKRELNADKVALHCTKNLASAISAIKKLTEMNPEVLPEELEDFRTHPREVERIKSLRKEAKKLGISDE